MEALVDLFLSLIDVLRSLFIVVISLVRVIVPWLPLFAGGSTLVVGIGDLPRQQSVAARGVLGYSGFAVLRSSVLLGDSMLRLCAVGRAEAAAFPQVINFRMKKNVSSFSVLKKRRSREKQNGCPKKQTGARTFVRAFAII